MRKKQPPPMQQLTLWDIPPEQPQEEEEMITDPYGNMIPAVIFKESRWADGDTSLPALERLAEGLLGDITTCYWGPPMEMLEAKHQWKRECGFYIAGYERCYYRCVASGVVDGKALGAYVYEKCLMDRGIRSKYGDEEDL